MSNSTVAKCSWLKQNCIPRTKIKLEGAREKRVEAGKTRKDRVRKQPKSIRCVTTISCTTYFLHNLQRSISSKKQFLMFVFGSKDRHQTTGRWMSRNAKHDILIHLSQSFRWFWFNDKNEHVKHKYKHTNKNTKHKHNTNMQTQKQKPVLWPVPTCTCQQKTRR